jgi:hypothetical protein
MVERRGEGGGGGDGDEVGDEDGGRANIMMRYQL